MSTARLIRKAGTPGLLLLLLAATCSAPAKGVVGMPTRIRDPQLNRPSHTKAWVIEYRSHGGRMRRAYVLLPRSYGPKNHPRIPLVIAPHGRGGSGHGNAALWGDLPAIGTFAVVNPDGDGDNLGAYSWGAPGQIDDLARMPVLVHDALPWLNVDHRRIYAVGGSMGGQETLLLLAKHPRLLAGAVAFDALVDFAHQYWQYPRLACNTSCRRTLGGSLGDTLQRLARTEVGGDPATAAGAFAARSPLTYAGALAASCIPLQLWWSRRDRIIVDSTRQSQRLLLELRRLNPSAPVDGIVGSWAHTAEMRASSRMPFALARFGLLPSAFAGDWGVAGAHLMERPARSCQRA